ncbi:ThiF family adenylyltransferase [Cohnella sp.]|uniref:HesA/MoeB/ThiF family protein n=1 Tax=Cohnella sp. TaxID=1883426 RepID=UPI003565B94E
MKPKLKPYCRHVMSLGDGVIRFKMERASLEIPDPEGTVHSFVRLLDGTRTIVELSQETGLTLGDTEDAVALFDRYRLLEAESTEPPGLTERELVRYKNNLTYFSLHESLMNSRYDCQVKLKNAKVAVVGLGGGSIIAAWLAAMGVGTIVGVDCDRVELNNLNRQFFYTEKDVGEYKTVALKRRLEELNGDIRVEAVQLKVDSASSLLQAISGADFVVGAIDTPPLLGSRYVNSACLHLNIPAYYVSIGNKLGFYYRVDPIESGCTDCRLLHIMRSEPELLETTKRKWNRAEPDADFGNPGFAPNVAVITSLIASEIAKRLTGYGEPFPMPFGLIDFQGMSVSHRNIPKADNCPTCGRERPPEGPEPVPMEMLFALAESGVPAG